MESQSPEIVLKARHLSEEIKIKISEKEKGQHHSIETEFKKGHTLNRGRKMPEGFQIGKRIGENNPRWKGGISSLNIKLRNSSLYKIWKNAVFLRDNFICQNPECEYCHNQEGMILHAHHIKSFIEFPELRFIVNNGITYCEGYHLHSGLHKIIQEVRNG